MKLTGIIIVLLVTASILFTATEAMAGRGSVKHSSKKGTQTSAAGKSAGTRTTAKTGSNTATRTTTTRTTTTAKLPRTDRRPSRAIANLLVRATVPDPVTVIPVGTIMVDTTGGMMLVGTTTGGVRLPA